MAARRGPSPGRPGVAPLASVAVTFVARRAPAQQKAKNDSSSENCRRRPRLPTLLEPRPAKLWRVHDGATDEGQQILRLVVRPGAPTREQLSATPRTRLQVTAEVMQPPAWMPQSPHRPSRPIGWNARCRGNRSPRITNSSTVQLAAVSISCSQSSQTAMASSSFSDTLAESAAPGPATGQRMSACGVWPASAGRPLPLRR